VPDLVGEPVNRWGDTNSLTHKFMREYTGQVVARYVSSPAIWGWEFGNEFNLVADLPNAAQHRPPVVPQLGTPATRSAEDELSHKMIRTAFHAFAEEVRRLDSRRITSRATRSRGLPRGTRRMRRAGVAIRRSNSLK